MLRSLLWDRKETHHNFFWLGPELLQTMQFPNNDCELQCSVQNLQFVSVQYTQFVSVQYMQFVIVQHNCSL
jgi:hypothetical protein